MSRLSSHLLATLFVILCYVSGSSIKRLGNLPTSSSGQPFNRVRSAGQLNQLLGSSPDRKHFHMRQTKSTPNLCVYSQREAASTSLQPPLPNQPPEYQERVPEKSTVIMDKFFKRDASSHKQENLQTKQELQFKREFVDWLLMSTFFESFVKLPQDLYRASWLISVVIHIHQDMFIDRMQEWLQRVKGDKVSSQVLCGKHDAIDRYQAYVLSLLQARSSDPADVLQDEESMFGYNGLCMTRDSLLKVEDIDPQSMLAVELTQWLIVSAAMTYMYNLPQKCYPVIESQVESRPIIQFLAQLKPKFNEIERYLSISFHVLRRRNKERHWNNVLQLKNLVAHYLLLHDFLHSFSQQLQHVQATQVVVDVAFAHWVVQVVEQMMTAREMDGASFNPVLTFQSTFKEAGHIDSTQSAAKTITQARKAFETAEPATTAAACINQAADKVQQHCFSSELTLQIMNGVHAGIRIMQHMLPQIDLEPYATVTVSTVTIGLTLQQIGVDPKLLPTQSLLIAVKAIEFANALKIELDKNDIEK